MMMEIEFTIMKEINEQNKQMDRLELKLRIFEKIFPENMSNVYAGQNIDNVLKIVNKIYNNFIEIQ